MRISDWSSDVCSSDLTGIVAERFGGQVLDTLGIENFISVQQTEGPKLAAQLEAHVKDYEVEAMHVQEAAGRIPGGPTALHEAKLKSGARVKAATVILSTGADRRSVGKGRSGSVRVVLGGRSVERKQRSSVNA